MITLRNIKKTYKTKKGRPFEALKGVSLALPERGMVFLLGRSGSGKTTLLNIIGLLDRPTEGTVEVDGAVLQGKGLDSFRNRFSGFVFQEFALLEEETVGQNVALALRLQNTRETDAQVAEALARVGLEGYEGRYPYELSGGEKQRVAIARAIVKHSEMILADEPTGNLDSENGEEIFEILKSLSEEKLVVVVSHDRGFAEKYADRIVSLKDGLIVSDTAPLPIPEVPAEEPAEAGAPQHREAGKARKGKAKEELGVKAHLPTMLAFRMGWRNFGQKKIKSAITFILAVFSMTVLVFSQVFFSFDAERAIAKTVKRNDIESLLLYQRDTPDAFAGHSSFGLGSPFHDFDSNDALDGISHLMMYEAGNLRGAVIESVQDIEKMGFSLYDGAQEISDDAIYISDYWLESHLYPTIRRVKWQYGGELNQGWHDLWYNRINTFVREGEELVPLDPAVYDYTTLVGKTVAIRNSFSSIMPYTEFRVAGIVKTGYEEFFTVTDSYFPFESISYEDYIKEHGEGAFHDEEVYNALIGWMSEDYPDCFFTRTYANRNQSIIRFRNETFDPYALSLSNTVLFKEFDSLGLAHINRHESNDRIIMEGASTAVYPADVTLNEGEIILSERAYNYLFDNELMCAFCLDEDTVLHVPYSLGSTVRLKIEHDGEGLIEREFRIVGVMMSIFDESPQLEITGTVYMGDTDMEKSAEVGLRPGNILIRTVGIGELKLRSALRALRYDHALATQFAYSEYIYGAEYYQEAVGLAFLAVGLIMMLVTMLIVVSLISYNILAQRREIGILRALGARSVDVSKIYLAQAVILSAVTLLLSMAISLILISVFNSTIAADLLYGLILIGYTPLTGAVLVLGSFGAMLLGTALPLRKISRIQPAEAIKKG